MRRIEVVVIGAAALVAFGAAGSSAIGSARTDAADAHGVVAAPGAVVGIRQTLLGRVLVVGAGRSRGRTLYMFTPDSRTRSRCFGSCASVWTPLGTAGAPRALAGAERSKLGTIRRGHSRQVTYGGHPLYLYTGDSRAGQVNGEGIKSFGGSWWALSAGGRAVKPRSAAPMAPAPSPYPGY